MNRKELDEEIEYVHSNRLKKILLRPKETIRKVIIEATTSYTNLSLFMNDYMNLYVDELIDVNLYISAMNDLYLLALLHTSCEEEENDK